MEILVREIEKEGEKYGMKLNKDKCEALATAQNEEIKFSDKTVINTKKEVKYLGCRINQKTNKKKEINKRISEVYVTLKNWENSGNIVTVVRDKS